MADIVERLRDGMTREQVAATGIVPALWGEAADEIERLRTELAEAKSTAAAAVNAERERCAGIAKTGWLSADYDTVGIADADVAAALCEHIAAAIRRDTTE